MRFVVVICLDTSKTPEGSRNIFTIASPAAQPADPEPVHAIPEIPTDGGSTMLAHWGIPD